MRNYYLPPAARKLFCRICHRQIWYGHICSNIECLISYSQLALEKCIRNSRRTLALPDDRVVYLTPSRPWTADCILNLWINLSNDMSIEQSARETRRTPREVYIMCLLLKRHGFDRIYSGLVKREISELPLPEEIKILHNLELI